MYMRDYIAIALLALHTKQLSMQSYVCPIFNLWALLSLES